MYRKLFSVLIALVLLITCVVFVSADAPILFDYAMLPRQQAQQQIDGQALTAVPCEDGFADIYPCDNVDLLAFVPFADMGGQDTRGADIWGWTDPQNGDEYVIHTLRTGTVFFRITDPENPVYLGLLPTHTDDSNWRDAKVYANHAYIVSEASEHGLQVFDLTQLRGITTPQTWSNTAHYAEFGSAHNIAINEDSGFAYAVGAKGGTGATSTVAQNCAGGLHMVDISDPAVPVNAGCFDEDGYTHDAQCVIYSGPDSDYSGREICFNLNEDTLTIADVTDKSAPVMVSRTPGFVGCVTRTTCYTHQGWLTEDQAYFFVDDELDEQQLGVPTTTYIWDVADLDAPVLAAEYAPGIPSIDHNLYIRGESAFLSNYTSGLRILNISNPLVPQEIAFFDVYPAHDNPVFTGTWSNYPYFESGVIAVSSIDRGLFLLKPKDVLFKTADTTLTSCAGAAVDTTLSTFSIFELNTADLAAANLPDGVTMAFGDNVLNSGESTTVMLDNLSNAQTNFTAQITGSENGNAFTSETIDVIVGAPNVAAAPIAPAAFSIDSIPRTTFVWQPVFDATSYRLEVSDTADFSNLIYVDDTTATQYEVTGLQNETMFYWRVTAINPCGSTVSAATPFIVRPTANLCAITYENSFENGVGDWDRTPINEWVNSWTITNTVTHGGSGAWYAPDTNLQLQLLSSDVFAVNGDEVTLTFWQRRDLDMDGDVAQLLIETPDDFFLAEGDILSEPYNSVTPYWTSNGQPPAGWSGFQDWTQTSVDLTSYNGQQLFVDFLLFSDNVVSTDLGSGWAIDDMQVKTCNYVAAAADFSDLPISYGIAWHSDDGSQRIGSTWSSDTVLTADNDDDDIAIPSLTTGEENAVTVTVTADGWVNVWFDWDEDGTFSDSERAVNQAVTAGENTLAILVPTIDPTTDLAYRVRVSADSVDPALSASGSSPSGEVEDGYVSTLIDPTQPTAVALTTQNAASGWAAVLLVVTLCGLTAVTRTMRP